MHAPVQAAFMDMLETSEQHGPRSSAALQGAAAARDAAAGDADDAWKRQKSRGALGDMVDLFKALGGGAHIVRRDDGSI